MKFVACYIRVSVAEKSLAKQKRAINRWLKASRMNEKSVRWYIDKGMDATSRPKFDRLQNAINEGQVRAVVVFHFDRLSRTTRDGLGTLIQWCERPIRVVSVSQRIDVKAGDVDLVARILRSVAEMDEETRRERTKLGLESARAQGRSGGRPRISADEAAVIKAKALRKKSVSVKDICKKLNISRSTYYRYISMSRS